MVVKSWYVVSGFELNSRAGFEEPWGIRVYLRTNIEWLGSSCFLFRTQPICLSLCVEQHYTPRFHVLRKGHRKWHEVKCPLLPTSCNVPPYRCTFLSLSLSPSPTLQEHSKCATPAEIAQPSKESGRGTSGAIIGRFFRNFSVSVGRVVYETSKDTLF